MMESFKLWFQSPEWLWALWLLAPVAALDMMRKPFRERLGRGLLAMVLRILMLAALIIAAASPMLEREKPSTDVIFVVDISESVGDATLAEALERIDVMRDDLPSTAQSGLVTFDEDAHVLAYPSDDWELPATLRAARVDGESAAAAGTDIAEGVDTAMGLIRQGSAGRVVLMSDGRNTRGSLDAIAERAAQRGVHVHTVVLDTSRDDLLLSALEVMPREILPGETIEAKIKLFGATQDSTIKVVLRVDDEQVMEQEVEVPANVEHEAVLEYAVKSELEPGKHEVSTIIEMPGQAGPVKLEKTSPLLVREAANVLIVTSAMEEVEPLGRALEAEGMNPVVVLTEKLYDEDAPKLDDMDLVILGNVPAQMDVLPPGVVPMPSLFIRDLRKYVSSGGGLVVLGGNLSYDLGGYGGTELRKILPVELEPEDSELHQPVTMIIILDRSGSMGASVGNTTKMDLTNRGAVAAMKLLRPYDNVGVMSVDEYVHWNVPVQPARITSRMTSQVRGIYADGGGIFCYTALVAAWDALRRVDTPLKHVILFSDAMDAEEQVKGIMIGWGPGPNSYDLAEDMVRDGITVSAIGVGSNYDVDTPFLRNLAKHGKGNFRITSNARKLESLFVEETTQLLQLKIKEKKFRPTVKLKHPSLKEIDMKKAPRLRGYIELEAKPTSQVVMTGPEDHPIMVTWQYGLGQVTTLATDAGPRWAGNWMDWKGYPKFWTQLSRWSLRRSEGRSTGVQVKERAGRTVVEVVRRTNLGESQDEHIMRGLVRKVGEESWQSVEVAVVEPGRYEAELDLPVGEGYEFGLVSDDGEALLTHTFATPASSEQRFALPDEEMLKTLSERTGGALLSSETALSGVLGEPGKRFEEKALWLWAALCALGLLVLDAFARRSLRS